MPCLNSPLVPLSTWIRSQKSLCGLQGLPQAFLAIIQLILSFLLHPVAQCNAHFGQSAPCSLPITLLPCMCSSSHCLCFPTACWAHYAQGWLTLLSVWNALPTSMSRRFTSLSLSGPCSNVTSLKFPVSLRQKQGPHASLIPLLSFIFFITATSGASCVIYSVSLPH